MSNPDKDYQIPESLHEKDSYNTSPLFLKKRSLPSIINTFEENPVETAQIQKAPLKYQPAWVGEQFVGYIDQNGNFLPPQTLSELNLGSRKDNPDYQKSLKLHDGQEVFIYNPYEEI